MTMLIGNRQVGKIVENAIKDDRVGVLQYADCYENSLHEADKRSVMDFNKMIEKKELKYTILIDLHDIKPTNRSYREAIKATAEGFTLYGLWAPVYLDNQNDVVCTWNPHFTLIVPKYNKPLLRSVIKYLRLRQGDVPPYMIDGGDPMDESLDYMKWYRDWQKKELRVIPAGIKLCDLPSDYDIGRNHLVVEFLPKIDFLTDKAKNGNVHKITTEDGFSFVRNLIDFFVENHLEMSEPSL